MSKRIRVSSETNKTGKKEYRWIVPQEQVIEFFSNDIDYNKLINDCMLSLNRGKFSIKK